MSELGQVLNRANASVGLVSILTSLCPSCGYYNKYINRQQPSRGKEIFVEISVQEGCKFVF